MGTALTGLEIRDTYDALIKITDNGPIGATAKLLSDGLGNDSVLTLSTTSVGVGGDTSGTVSGVTINAKFCVKSEGTVSGAGFVYANDTTAANGSVIYACRSRGTIASPTAVVSGDRLASLIFAGNDGTDLALAAQINIEADGTVGANDMPGRITFLTTPDGTQAPTEKMRIANDGKLKFNSYGSGTITGTAAYNLGVDASGNVIELPGGVIDGAGTANYVPKWTDANTLGDSQLFDNGTSVGIGTATPGQKLVVSGGTNGRVRINVTEGTGNFGKFEFSTSDSLTTSAVMLSEITAAITDSDPNTLKADLSFSTNSGDSLAEVMRITSTGRVGIGTTTPALLLDIVGTNSVGVKVTETGGSEARLVAGGSTTFFGTYSDHPLAILTNSIERVRITSAGNVGIGTSSPADKLHVSNGNIKSSNSGNTISTSLSNDGVYAAGTDLYLLAPATKFVAVYAGNAEAMRITASGNVGIGTTPSAWGSTFRALQIGAGTAVYNNDAANGSFFVSNSFYNGSNNIYKNDGTATAYGQISGKHSFFTAPSGTAGGTVAFVERVAITSDGLTFNGDTAAANALDDYEEGTWTPTVVGTSGTATYTNQQGYYTKIGRQVTINWFISFQKNTLSGDIQLRNLPFTVGNFTNYYPQAIIMLDNLASAYTNPLLQLGQNSIVADVIVNNGSTGSHSAMQDTQLGPATMAFRGTATYFV
jgi:hypothetical protein